MTEFFNIKTITENGIEYQVEINPNGDEWWSILGIGLHRVDNPAVKYKGSREWWLKGKLVYADYTDRTSEHKLTDIMAMQIIKYKLNHA